MSANGTNDDWITIELSDLYRQLRFQILEDPTAPQITVPRLSTRSECSQIIAESLKLDKTLVRLETKEQREKRHQKARTVALEIVAAFKSENPKVVPFPTKPIKVDMDTLEPSLPKRPTPERRQRLKELALKARDDPHLRLDPYPITLIANPFETYLATVLGQVEVEIIDAEEDEKTKYCLLGEMNLL